MVFFFVFQLDYDTNKKCIKIKSKPVHISSTHSASDMSKNIHLSFRNRINIHMFSLNKLNSPLFRWNVLNKKIKKRLKRLEFDRWIIIITIVCKYIKKKKNRKKLNLMYRSARNVLLPWCFVNRKKKKIIITPSV